jgi:N-acetylmuramoyl-L-alanine amidase
LYDIKIILDAGHYGKYNCSPAVPEYYESDMSWALHLKLKAELEKYGFEVGTTRKTQDKDLEVYARGVMAKGYDMFISLHSNAVGGDVRDDVDRPVVIRLDNDINGDKLARNVTNMIAEVMQTKQAGTVTTRVQDNGKEYYGVLRGAKAAGCPHAYIIEHSFHTATKPTEWLLADSNLDILAKREAELIAEFFGVYKKEEGGEPMTEAEKKAFVALEERVKKLENDNKVYHWYKELPDWARPTIQALHRGGVFAGAGVGDMNLPKDMMRILFINAKSGLYGEQYKNL